MLVWAANSETERQDCGECRDATREYPKCLLKTPQGITLPKPTLAILKTNGEIWEYLKANLTPQMKSEYAVCKYLGLCEWPLIDPECYQVVSMINICREHHGFPYPGSYTDQPAWYIGAFGIITRAQNEASNYRMSKGNG